MKNIKGSFCYITKWGNRIDCPIFFTSILKDKQIIFDFNSTFEGLNGKVKLTVISNDKLMWEILKNPKGEFYAPTKELLSLKSDSNLTVITKKGETK